MIIHFRDDKTETLFKTGKSRKFSSIGKIAKRKLDALNAALALNDLLAPPGNHFEVLQGNREGQHSIRVNDQYRVCFRWTEEGIKDVEITDYY